MENSGVPYKKLYKTLVQKDPISKEYVNTKQMCARIAADSGIPATVVKSIVNMFVDMIPRSLNEGKNVFISDIVYFRPVYVHPYLFVTEEGKEVSVPGRVTIYTVPQRGITKAKKVLRERYGDI